MSAAALRNSASSPPPPMTNKTGGNVWEPVRVSGSASGPLPRSWHSAVSLGSKIYLFGGIRDGAVCADMQILNLEGLCGWKTPSFTGSTPKARCGHTATLVPRNSMLVFGGADNPNGDELAPPDMNVLNLDTFAWGRPRTSGSPPDPVCHHTAIFVATSGSVFFLCGKTSKGPINSFYTYSTNNRAWAVLPKPPLAPRYHHITVAMGSKLYTFGGTDGKIIFNDFWSYEIGSSHWMQVAVEGICPPPLYGHSAIVVANRILVWGGLSEQGPNENMFAFDVNTSHWFHVTPASRGFGGDFPGPRIGFVCTEANRKVYLIGGIPPNGPCTAPSLATPFVLSAGKLEYLPISPRPDTKLLSTSSETLQSKTPDLRSTSLTTSTSLITEPASVRQQTPPPHHTSAQLQVETHPPPSHSPQIQRPLPQHPPSSKQSLSVVSPPILNEDKNSTVLSKSASSPTVAKKDIPEKTITNVIKPAVTGTDTLPQLDLHPPTKLEVQPISSGPNEVELLRAQLVVAQSVKENLESRLANMQTQLQSLEQIKLERNGLLESKGSALHTVDTLNTEKEKLQKQNAALEVEKSKLRDDFSALQGVTNSLKAEFATNKTLWEGEKEKLQQELSKLSKEFAEQASCLTSLSKEKIHSEAELSQLKLQLQSESTHTQEEINKLQRKLSEEGAMHTVELTRLREQLTQQSSSVPLDTEHKLTCLQAEVAQYNQQLACEKEAVSTLSKQLSEARVQLSEGEDKYRKLLDEKTVQQKALKEAVDNYTDLTTKFSNLKTLQEVTSRDRDELHTQIALLKEGHTLLTQKHNSCETTLKEKLQLIEKLRTEKEQIERDREMEKTILPSDAQQSILLEQMQSQAVQLTELHLRLGDVEMEKDQLQQKYEVMLLTQGEPNSKLKDPGSESISQNVALHRESELQTQLAAVEKERDTLKLELSKAQEKLLHSETIQKELNEALVKEKTSHKPEDPPSTEQLERVQRRHELEVSSLQIKLDEALNTISKQASTVSETEMELEHQRHQCEELRGTVSKLNSKIQENESKLNQNEASASRKELEVMHTLCDLLHTNADCLIDNVTTLQKDIQQRQTSCEEKDVQLAKLTDDIVALRNTNSSLEGRMKELTVSVEENKQILNQLETEKMAFVKQVADLSSRTDELKILSQTMTVERENLRSELADHIKLFKEKEVEYANKLTDMKNALVTSQAEKKKLEADLARLEQENRAIKTDVDRAVTRICQVTTENKGLEHSTKHLQSQFDEASVEKLDLQTKLEKLTVEHSEKLNELKELSDSREREISTHKNDAQDLQTKLEKVESDLTVSATTILSLQQRVKELTDELLQSTSEHTAAQELLQSHITQHRVEQQELQAKIDSLTSNGASEKNDLDLRLLQSKIEQLNTELLSRTQTYETEKANMQLQIDKLSTELNNSVSVNENAKISFASQVSELRTELAQKVEACDAVKITTQSTIDQLTSELRVFRAAENTSHDQNKELNERLHAMELEMATKLESSASQIQKITAENSHLKAQLELLNQTKKESDDAVSTLQKDIQDKLNESSEEVKRLQARNTALQSQIDGLLQSNSKAKDEQELQERKLEIENLVLSNAELQEQRDLLKKTLEELEQNTTIFMTELETLRTEKKNHEEEVLTLRNSLATLDENCKLLSNALSDLQQQQQQPSGGSVEVETLRQQIDVLTQEFNNLQENRDQWKAAAEAMEQLGRQSAAERDSTIAELTMQKERLENTLASVEQKNDSLDRMLKKLANLKV
ncbi:hypothetical protein Pelo_10101 [Pelomyxa schiedti]|nr:hypothetical protein Pelo_10101 [Pelomyxa schiedti]